MKNIIDIITNFDYSQESINKLSEYSNELNKLPIVSIKIEKGREIYRCRQHKNINEMFYFATDISYRTDLQNINDIGRCNTFNSSKFYGSINSAEMDKGYLSSIFETSTNLINNIDGYERFTIGTWVAKEDFYLTLIRPNSKNKKKSLIILELNSVFDNNSKYPFSTEQIDFYTLLGDEFSKEVKDNEKYLYWISAIISEVIMQFTDGIAFPSTKNQQKGFNIVLNPDRVDKYLELQNVIVVDLFKFKDYSYFRKLYIAELKDSFPFKWRDVKDNERLDLSDVIYFFKTKEIYEEYIIKKLLEQISNK